MMEINTYDKSNTAKKDFMDKHTPFITCKDSAKKGETIEIKITLGEETAHPDDFNHYISSVSLFAGQKLLAKAEFMAGYLGNEAGHVSVTFHLVATKNLKLSAQAYCTTHGTWESETKEVEVN